jgi:hypothetical protein
MTTTDQRFTQLNERMRQRRRPTWILGIVVAIAVARSGCWVKPLNRLFHNPDRTPAAGTQPR